MLSHQLGEAVDAILVVVMAGFGEAVGVEK
jgi:hypothetical protein